MPLYYLIAVIIIALDQWTKQLVLKHMERGESIPLIADVFHLTSHRNMGAAFGILQNQRWLFIIITLAVVVGIIYSLIRIGKKQPRVSLALSLVLGGAVGNFIDRATTGQVVDFLDFTLINFPIFNVADMAITIGVVVLLLDVLLEGRKNGR
ncbi:MULTISPECIES: signal peptidase II [Brevibacillus]|uniref:Lipoprotein signal peptidase n=1 Tax=Brevibacillus nitrificans TaxID=651560 RepID=A0A3M8DRP8_9BACL|nr:MULTISPECIES: signal peptidase II [Brevibacillus]MEC2128211.1 signal peptidase II [Brevibacillus centrosporus]MED1796855.1 signal peptidase II [Brevibacillus nitrificans]MED1951539.1 signal peptidase II [Brevibacillus centrosporus]MED4909632.1 signal peptidase II [Brevibacillus centrosporus]RNB73929.1 lipoprotein signal peptidase [Brevibacillus centrosporus]